MKSKHISKFLLLIVLLLGITFTTTLAAPTITNLDDNTYIENQVPIIIDNDITFSSGTNYRDGYLRFALSNSTANDQLSIQSDASPTTNGAISIVGSDVFWGDGTQVIRIGTVDATENGQNGQPLKILFSAPLDNFSFETGLNEWVTYAQEFNASSTDYAQDMNGDPIYYYMDGGLTTGWGTIILGTNSNVTFSASTSTVYASEGTNSLLLHSNGNIVNSGGTRSDNPTGNLSLHGPYAVSAQSFYAFPGDQISIDWRAQGGGDDYEVFGFLVQDETIYTKLFSQRGDVMSTWNTQTANITIEGNYKFLFVGGTYDATGGYLVGADLYVDNIRLLSSGTINDDVVTAVAQHVTFENTSDAPDTTTRGLTVSAQASDSTTGSATANIDITAVNDAPVSSAGPDQYVATNNVVTLNATGSTDVEGDTPLTYLWAQTGGTAVTLSDDTAAMPTFTAPAAPSLLTFTLTATDSQGLADPTPDSMFVSVEIDTDGDGIRDVTENDAGTDLNDPTDNDTEAEQVATIVAASDSPADGAPTAGDLVNPTLGLLRVNYSSMSDYEEAIANASPAPTTKADLQAIIDGVNATSDGDNDGISNGTENDAGTNPNDGTDNDTEAERVATIVAASDSPADGAPNLTDLTNIGLVRLVNSSLSDYEEAFANASPSPTTLAELQAIVDGVNQGNDSDSDGISDATEIDAGTNPNDGTDNDTEAEKVATLVAASDTTADGAPTATDLTNSGLIRVITTSMDSYEAAIANASPAPTTLVELQAIIDGVNQTIDTDHDGICDATEFEAGTSPTAGSDNDEESERVATIVAASNTTANGTPTADDLSNIGLVNVNPGSISDYEEAIANASPVPTTYADLQAIIDGVNATADSDGDGFSNATELDAGTNPNDGTDNDTEAERVATVVAASDAPADGLPTAAELGNIGLVRVVAGSMNDYEEAFANASPVPTSLADLQAIIDGINQATDSDSDGISDATELDAGTNPNDGTDNDTEAEQVATIVAASDATADGAPTITDLTNIGLVRTVSGSMADYEEAFANASPAPTTLADLQAIIDAVNATSDGDGDGISNATELDAGTNPNDATDNDTEAEQVATIVAAADAPADGAPSETDLVLIGLVHIVPGSVAGYEEAIANASPAPTTLAELQAIIDAYNATVDSDSDGISDATEFEAGTNPNVGTDNDTEAEQVATIVTASDATANGLPTITDLVNIGLVRLVADSMSSYEEAFANASPVPTTLAELQAIIDGINLTTDTDSDGISDATELDAGTNPNDGTDNDTLDEQLTTLVAASDATADGSPTASELVMVGLQNVDPAKLDQYEAGFNDPTTLGLSPFSSPPTLAELQEVINRVNGYTYYFPIFFTGTGE
ncbi:MAG: hypothetical protein H6667_25700 [Ardenticatenaceae bacterium]|nr:hypothetical protein [Ardenticatenaceae bacterium]